jgi:hypothetical protein
MEPSSGCRFHRIPIKKAEIMAAFNYNTEAELFPAAIRKKKRAALRIADSRPQPKPCSSPSNSFPPTR